MSSNLTRAFVVVVAIALILIAVTLGIKVVLPATASSSGSPQLATAAYNSFQVAVNESGSVVPASVENLNFAVGGTIASIGVNVGQRVSMGTTLATLQNGAAMSAVAQAEANLSAAQAKLSAAQNPLTPAESTSLETVLSNSEQVLSQTVASVQQTASIDAQNVQSDETALQSVQSEFNSANCSSSANSSSTLCQSYSTQMDQDQRQLTLDQERSQSDAAAGSLRESEAQGQVNAAQAALSAASTPNPSLISEAQAQVNSANGALQQAQSRLVEYSLTSPVKGIVLSINGQVGENVTGAPTATQTLPGTTTPLSSVAPNVAVSQLPFIVIGQPSRLVVGFSFPSANIGQVQVGQKVLITSQSVSQLNLSGKIMAISGAPINVSGVPSYFATVAMDSSKGLSWGMSVGVSVLVSKVTSVLAIPISAVFTVGGVPRVNVWNGKSAVETTVTLGAQGLTLVQVTSGLAKGQQVELASNQGFAQAGLP